MLSELVQGWFGEGAFRWPLLCPPTNCPIDCVTSLRFWPYVAFSAVIFYVAALIITVLKSIGRWPEHNGINTRFDNTFFVAWHVPNIFACIPLSIMALSASWDLWSADSKLQYGSGTTPHKLSEAGIWFCSYLVLDTVLITVHRLGTKEDYLHHGIFSIVGYVIVMNCSLNLTAAVLLSQELSTPALNVFQWLRAFAGPDNVVTQATFILFALQFCATRVVLNTANTLMFALEVKKAVNGSSAFDISQPLQWLLLVVLVAASCLQLYWAKGIANIIYKAMRGISPDPDVKKKQ